jgi:predicted nucleic-acid-binding Zn-ribbon protein
MTISTIASAKGYDAPVVFLIGADELATDLQGRASFYVGATRAKLSLFISGTKQRTAGLLDELLLASQSLLASRSVITPPPIAVPTPLPLPATPEKSAKDANAVQVCRHCGSKRLHAQHGRFGYFYRCIDCTENTPIDMTCPRCGKKGRVRKAELQFFRECQPCGYSELIHTNVPLDQLNG